MATLAQELLTDADRAFRAAVEATRKTLVARSPVDTGAMRASIRTTQLSGPRAGIFTATIETTTGDEYPSILDTGSRPHKIRARNAKILTDGENFFGVEVNHPGSTKDVGWWSSTAVDAVFDEALGDASGR